MKKQYLPLLLILAACASCGAHTTAGNINSGNSFSGIQDVLWIDDDTLQTRGYGKADPEIRNLVQRQTIASQLALLDAQDKASVELTGRHYQNITSENDNPAAEPNLPFPCGTVVEKKFDTSHNCYLLYRISKKGLKKAVP